MADKTINETTDLDWVQMKPTLWMCFLPTITGYMHPRYANAFAEVRRHGDSWCYQIDVDTKETEDASAIAFLSNKDFNTPNGATATEMKQAVGNLTIPQIKAKLIEKGYQPTYQWTVND